jgi:hypothetical protein
MGQYFSQLSLLDLKIVLNKILQTYIYLDNKKETLLLYRMPKTWYSQGECASSYVSEGVEGLEREVGSIYSASTNWKTYSSTSST